MGLASVCSKAMVLLLLIHWLYVLSLFGWVCVVIGPCYALLSGLSLLQTAGRGRIAGCFTLIIFLLALFLVLGAPCLFLAFSWVGLQCVFVVFPRYTYLFLGYITHACFCFVSHFTYFIVVIITLSHYS